MSDNEFPPHLFYHFCRLRHLTLANQHVKRIEDKDFENANHLNYLDLSGNDIERINGNVFRHALNLSIIDLANNKIEFIDDEAFDYTMIRRLNLDGNNIKTVFKWRPFDDKLYQFTLNNNVTYEIRRIRTSAEWNRVVRPFTLDASNNPLVNSSDSIRVKAHEMDLQNNTLAWVTIYRVTTKLEAQNNHISRIVLEEDGIAFQLKYLNLSKNSLAAVPELSNLTTLEEVDLSHNLFESMTQDLFSELIELRKLLLNNNKLKNINSDAFSNNLPLAYLDLSNNNLRTFRLFGFFPRLTELKFNNNHVIALDANIKRVAPKLEKAGLNGNNWTCDHLNRAMPLIPVDQIELDIDNSFLSRWLAGDNHGQVMGVTCLLKV